jgi:hypothetical protein
MKFIVSSLTIKQLQVLGSKHNSKIPLPILDNFHLIKRIKSLLHLDLETTMSATQQSITSKGSVAVPANHFWRF